MIWSKNDDGYSQSMYNVGRQAVSEYLYYYTRPDLNWMDGQHSSGIDDALVTMKPEIFVFVFKVRFQRHPVLLSSSWGLAYLL